MQVEEGQEREQLTEAVRKTLVGTPENSCQNLELIDAIQQASSSLLLLTARSRSCPFSKKFCCVPFVFYVILVINF